MLSTATIGRPTAARLSDLRTIRAQQPHAIRREGASDRVEVSDHARWMNKLASMPSIRQERIDRVRAQIATGTYDVEGKLDAALNQLLDDVR